jgi:diguanylate cyclase (GGDEF)-like protein
MRYLDRRRRASGIEPRDHRESLVRAAELRRTLRPGSLLVTAVCLGTGILLAIRFPASATVLFPVWTLGAAANLAIWFVADRAPQPLVVPLTLVFAGIPATGLLVSAFEPSTLQAMISGFTMLPVAVPLFLAWSRSVRTGWVLSYATVFVGVSLVTGLGHLDTVQRIDVGIGVLIGALLGWLGGEMLERLRERALEQATELRRLNDELQIRATTDALTGLANRRQLDTDLQALNKVQAGEGGSCAFLMLDLDRFKRLNDELGHAAGDEALRSVSAELQRVVRRRDTIYRYGGEEFLVIMRETSLEAGAATGERIREAVADLQIRAAARPASPTLTISCGVAYSPVARTHWDPVLAAADSALYEAKATGRNRVCVASAFAGQDPPLLPRDRRRPPLRKSTPAAREHVPVSGAG